MKKFKKRSRKLFVRVFARKIFQAFFKKLHWISLRGMNYGGGHSPHDSGEIFLLNHIKNNTKGQTTIFDVGANIGQYANLANKVFESNCLIYSFEPVESTFSALKKNTKNHENIIAVNKGMAEEVGQSKIYYNGPGSVQSSLIEDEFSPYSETIELTTIDGFCISNQINKIHLLKLDVEGYEYNALLGAKNSLNNIDYIQFEFGNKQVDSRNFLIDFIKILDDFKIYRLIQNGFVEVDANPINEIFQTSNYIAINKKIGS
tara:strand:- start:15640 stop:16419 length:780 start_codon:yes stop_codon:yes gene_type:complete